MFVRCLTDRSLIPNYRPEDRSGHEQSSMSTLIDHTCVAEATLSALSVSHRPLIDRQSSLLEF